MERGINGSADGITWLRGTETARRSATKAEDVGEALGIPKAELTPRVRTAAAALLREVTRLRAELDHSRSRIAQLEKLADEDVLVLVANRRAFVRELARMMSFARRYRTPISVIYLDIDNMKQVNDAFGHAAGDAAITHVAAVLAESVRGSDVVGRLGGDEFGIILAHADEAAARTKADRLRRAIAARPVVLGGRRIAVAVSCGVHGLAVGDDAQAMVEKADRAMYARKRRDATTSC